MDNATFAQAIDFAIGRERAAVTFYEELLLNASFAAQRSTLAEFRAMEQGHVSKLTNMKARGGLRLSAKASVDLGLATRLAESETPTSAMTFQDILVAAIKKEERSGSLYADLATSSPDEDTKGVFDLLAIEEGRHKRYFEELYDSEVTRDN
ncbi:MAG: ferritin family protein [Rectinemataceae bacterium]|nr:ferritin family protein [Rectinemataceae bacterium]